MIKHFGSVIHCVLNRLSQCQVVRNNCAACVQALWLLHEIQCLTDVQTGACFVITWSLFYILDYGRTDNFDRAINEFKKGYQLGKLC